MKISKEVTINMETLMMMFIIAMGEWDGICFVYYPKLPKPFSENIDFNDSCGCSGDLLSLRVDPTDLGSGVQFWFADDEDDSFFYTWSELKKSHPTLCAIVFTHIFDMINNLED